MHGLQLPRPCQEKNLSLSMMAQVSLGRPLDKSMQVSRYTISLTANFAGAFDTDAQKANSTQRADGTFHLFGDTQKVTALSTIHRWGRRPLSERQIQYAALDALVSVLIYDFIEGRSGSSLVVQIQQSAAPGSQSSTRARQIHPTCGPDQRLPKHLPEHELSLSSMDETSSDQDATQKSHTNILDQTATHAGGERQPGSSTLAVINSSSQAAAQADSGKAETDDFLCSGSTSMHKISSSLGASQIPRVIMPIRHTQKRPYQPPLPHAQAGLSGELHVNLSQSLAPQVQDVNIYMCVQVPMRLICWHRQWCLMSAVLQILLKANPSIQQAPRRLTSQPSHPSLLSHV